MNNNNFFTSNFNKLRRDKGAAEYSRYLRKTYEKYGIPFGVLSDRSDFYKDYEIEAMEYIKNRKEMPKDLEEKLINTMQERMKERKYLENNNFKPISLEEAESLLGIKLD